MGYRAARLERIAVLHIVGGVGAGDQAGPAVSAAVQVEAEDVAVFKLRVFSTAPDDIDIVPHHDGRSGKIEGAQAFFFIVFKGFTGKGAGRSFPPFLAIGAIEADQSRAAIGTAGQFHAALGVHQLQAVGLAHHAEHGTVGEGERVLLIAKRRGVSECVDALVAIRLNPAGQWETAVQPDGPEMRPILKKQRASIDDRHDADRAAFAFLLLRHHLRLSRLLPFGNGAGRKLDATNLRPHPTLGRRHIGPAG